METTKAFPLRIAPDSSSLFDGFPYLSIRMAPGFSHITLAPRQTNLAFLLGIASLQCFLNQLITFAVIAAAFSRHIVNLFGMHKPHANYWVDAARQSGSVSGSRAFQRWRPEDKKSNVRSSEVLQ